MWCRYGCHGPRSMEKRTGCAAQDRGLACHFSVFGFEGGVPGLEILPSSVSGAPPHIRHIYHIRTSASCASASCATSCLVCLASPSSLACPSVSDMPGVSILACFGLFMPVPACFSVSGV